jgi:hypothetical protein
MKSIVLKIIATAIFFCSASANAAPLKLIFLFPGGQGDQQQAQSFLDGFSEALKRASDAKIQAEISYLSDPQQGAQFIQAQKPAGGIMSQDLFLTKGPAWQAKVIAQTLQLPSADGSNQYFLIGNKSDALPASGAVTVSGPQILEPSFVQKELFPNLPPLQWQVQRSANPVGELRAIGMGEKTGLILLDQYEWMNISRLKAAWVAGLKVLAESKKVNSAPFVVFPQNLPAETIPLLQEALIKMSQDPLAAETLGNLRLKGFKKPSS